MSSRHLRKKEVKSTLTAAKGTSLWVFHCHHHGTDSSWIIRLSSVMQLFHAYVTTEELPQSCLVFELLACSGVKSLTFNQFFESLLRSLHVITHTATQALQPRTGASLEEIEEENSERMEKQLLL